MNVISVICKGPDARLHLAPTKGNEASAFTLCLERWKDRKLPREGVQLCPECVEKWVEKSKDSNSNQGAQQ